MTDLIKTVEKQSIDSDLIVLFDLEYADGEFAYFTDHLNSDLTKLQFRDLDGTARTYENLPLKLEGVEVKSDGAGARPTLTVANILNTFRTQLNGLGYEQLLGSRLTRRTTLKKYLVGEPGDSGSGNSPVQFPKVTYIIDRIAERDSTKVVFELAPPHDLHGIMVPRRIIVGGACPFKYTGADPTRLANTLRGGCTWNRESLANPPLADLSVTGGGPVTEVYINKDDEYILEKARVEGVATDSTSVSSYEANEFYFTQVNLVKITFERTTQTESNVKEYWQCVENTTTAPVDGNTAWRRIRVWKNFDLSTEFKGYQTVRNNEYVKYTFGSFTMVYQIISVSVAGRLPVNSSTYWTRGDSCGKKLKSCKLRYQATLNTENLPGFSGKTAPRSLPFGGFPGAKQNR